MEKKKPTSHTSMESGYSSVRTLVQKTSNFTTGARMKNRPHQDAHFLAEEIARLDLERENLDEHRARLTTQLRKLEENTGFADNISEHDFASLTGTDFQILFKDQEISNRQDEPTIDDHQNAHNVQRRAGGSIAEMYGVKEQDVMTRLNNRSALPTVHYNSKHDFASLTGTDFHALFGDRSETKGRYQHCIDKHDAGSNLERDEAFRPQTRKNVPNQSESSVIGQQKHSVKTLNKWSQISYTRDSPLSQECPGVPTQVPTAPFSSDSIDDWVVVRTEENPECSKPRHFGPITDLSQLFKTTFQESQVYDPFYGGHDRHFVDRIKILKFNGRNPELFREFEMGILTKIVNNKRLDWDAKFLSLLGNLSGCPFSTVNAYSEKLNIENFVQAIEDLWYTYLQPEIYQNALVQQLLMANPVDVLKIETLKETEALITKIYRTFGCSMSDDIATANFLGKIKMTSKSKLEFLTWLASRHENQTLRSFKEWLSSTYKASRTTNLFY